MPKKKVELFKSLMVGVILRYDTVGRYSEEGVNDFLDELEDYLNHAAQEGHIFASLFLEGDDRPIEALGSSIDGFNMKQSRLLDVAVVFFFELPHLCTKTACETLADVVTSLVEDFCVVKVASANIPPAGRADFQKAVLGTAEGRTESFKRDMAKTGALPNPSKRNGGRYQAPRRATRYDRGYTEWTLEDDARARAAQKKPTWECWKDCDDCGKGCLGNPPVGKTRARELLALQRGGPGFDIPWGKSETPSFVVGSRRAERVNGMTQDEYHSLVAAAGDLDAVYVLLERIAR